MVFSFFVKYFFQLIHEEKVIYIAETSLLPCMCQCFQCRKLTFKSFSFWVMLIAFLLASTLQKNKGKLVLKARTASCTLSCGKFKDFLSLSQTIPSIHLLLILDFLN